MSKSAYDWLKWIDVKLLPSLAVLLVGFGELLNIPWLDIVAGGVMLVQRFLAEIMCNESDKYFADKEIVPATMGVYGDGSDEDE